MGTCHIHGLLFLFLLGTASLSCMYGKVAQHVRCHKGIYVSIEADPLNTFNWTSEKVETCDNGTFCQESILMITAGAEYAFVATKGCIPAGMPEMTLIQHTPAPGLMSVSFSNYCEEPLCNNKDSMSSIWMPHLSPAPSVSTSLSCPTCVALGTCFSAPSLPCPSGTTRCYQGKLYITGGDINTLVEVKGCTAITGCKLMSGVFSVGVMEVKEVCPHQSLTQPRKLESGATSLPISVWGLELLLLLLLQPLVHSGPGSQGTPF
ncbi:testis-expressed protein 101 [Trichechus inunguis]